MRGSTAWGPRPGAQARDAESKPLMDAFLPWAYAELVHGAPRDGAASCLAYAAVCSCPYVENVLSDGRLVLSNDRAEQGQSIFVVGRKNWLFSDTPRGAHASAAIYNIMTAARANGPSPRTYVERLLDEMPNAGEPADDAAGGNPFDCKP